MQWFYTYRLSVMLYWIRILIIDMARLGQEHMARVAERSDWEIEQRSRENISEAEESLLESLYLRFWELNSPMVDGSLKLVIEDIQPGHIVLLVNEHIDGLQYGHWETTISSGNSEITFQCPRDRSNACQEDTRLIFETAYLEDNLTKIVLTKEV